MSDKIALIAKTALGKCLFKPLQLLALHDKLVLAPWNAVLMLATPPKRLHSKSRCQDLQLGCRDPKPLEYLLLGIYHRFTFHLAQLECEFGGDPFCAEYGLRTGSGKALEECIEIWSDPLPLARTVEAAGGWVCPHHLRYQLRPIMRCQIPVQALDIQNGVRAFLLDHFIPHIPQQDRQIGIPICGADEERQLPVFIQDAGKRRRPAFRLASLRRRLAGTQRIECVTHMGGRDLLHGNQAAAMFRTVRDTGDLVRCMPIGLSIPLLILLITNRAVPWLPFAFAVRSPNTGYHHRSAQPDICCDLFFPLRLMKPHEVGKQRLILKQFLELQYALRKLCQNIGEGTIGEERTHSRRIRSLKQLMHRRLVF